VATSMRGVAVSTVTDPSEFAMSPSVLAPQLRSEIHAESLAPDGHCAIFRKIQVAAKCVVLVADVSLDYSQVNIAGLFHCRRVLRIVGGDHVHVNIGGWMC
jgi:hypothetical protein